MKNKGESPQIKDAIMQIICYNDLDIIGGNRYA